MAANTDLTDRPVGLIQKVLGDPSLFPDAFTQWIPRWINQNINVKLQAKQLPDIESPRLIGTSNQPIFQNSWVNYSASYQEASFWRDYNGRVFLDGIVSGGTPGASSAIFTMPAGYYPKADILVPVTSNGAFGVCHITSVGVVIALSGSGTSFSLCGISFRRFGS